MEAGINELGQPIGGIVKNWRTPPRPAKVPMGGKYCSLEPLIPADHTDGLFNAYSLDPAGSTWTYLGYGPFETLEDYRSWVCNYCLGGDPLFLRIPIKSAM